MSNIGAGQLQKRILVLKEKCLAILDGKDNAVTTTEITVKEFSTR